MLFPIRLQNIQIEIFLKIGHLYFLVKLPMTVFIILENLGFMAITIKQILKEFGHLCFIRNIIKCGVLGS